MVLKNRMASRKLQPALRASGTVRTSLRAKSTPSTFHMVPSGTRNQISNQILSFNGIRNRVVKYTTRATECRKPHFDKILIANRGEIACRIIRTAKKLGIRTVAIYSDVDKDSLHVKQADEAYRIGPAPSAESYLCMDNIIEACHRSGAQAVHPGYGFLSENAEFAERLARECVVFIGPPASAITSMGSKRESKNIMSAAGVPCIPGYHGESQDSMYLYHQAKQIGFPVLIKAIHGGGGKGMRIVTDSSEASFQEALLSAQRESLKAFGNDAVLIEKYIERPRHIEVQVFADSQGNVISLWERDCSVQRRNQKIIEEAPAPGITSRIRADLSAKAIAAAKAVNYSGAGTVEFIFDNDTQMFYFMEMNTRLQVEHPVTEMVTGLDLVQWQLEIAAGNPLPLSQSCIPLVGHSFEARIYAENPRGNFLPDSGRLIHLSTPPVTHIFAPEYSPVVPSSMALVPSPSNQSNNSPSLRIEQGFAQGDQIGVFYDSMIAKVVVHGKDRTEALRMLRRALDEYHVVGVSTNVDFLRALAVNESFVNAELETGFIAKHYDGLFPPITEPKPELLAQAALFIALRDLPILSPTDIPTPWTSFLSRRFGGDKYERIIVLQDDISDDSFNIRVVFTEPGFFDIYVETQYIKANFSAVQGRLLSPTTLAVTLNSKSLYTSIIPQPPLSHFPKSSSINSTERLHVFFQGQKSTLIVSPPKWLLASGGGTSKANKGALIAPMPSLVVEVRVKVGDRVEVGDAVVILESMKTETVMRANAAGVVSSIGCKSGQMVEEGKELMIIVDVKNCP